MLSAICFLIIASCLFNILPNLRQILIREFHLGQSQVSLPQLHKATAAYSFIPPPPTPPLGRSLRPPLHLLLGVVGRPRNPDHPPLEIPDILPLNCSFSLLGLGCTLHILPDTALGPRQTHSARAYQEEESIYLIINATQGRAKLMT